MTQIKKKKKKKKKRKKHAISRKKDYSVKHFALVVTTA